MADKFKNACFFFDIKLQRVSFFFLIIYFEKHKITNSDPKYNKYCKFVILTKYKCISYKHIKVLYFKTELRVHGNYPPLSAPSFSKMTNYRFPNIIKQRNHLESSIT